MILILSPAKIFRNDESVQMQPFKPLKYHKETEAIIKRMKAYSSGELEQLMKVSKEIADCNYWRFQYFDKAEALGCPAADYFYGEAFKALEAPTMSDKARDYMASHLRILSGLYGCVGAMEIIQPYRLEMGTKFAGGKENSLYALWKEPLTQEIKKALKQTEGEKVLINLASDEYSKAVDLKAVRKAYPVITLHFKVKRGEDYKVIGMYAKKARGLMARFICEKGLQSAEEVKAFDEEGYRFERALSDETDWVFVKMDQSEENRKVK